MDIFDHQPTTRFLILKNSLVSMLPDSVVNKTPNLLARNRKSSYGVDRLAVGTKPLF